MSMPFANLANSNKSESSYGSEIPWQVRELA